MRPPCFRRLAAGGSAAFTSKGTLYHEYWRRSGWRFKESSAFLTCVPISICPGQRRIVSRGSVPLQGTLYTTMRLGDVVRDSRVEGAALLAFLHLAVRMARG